MKTLKVVVLNGLIRKIAREKELHEFENVFMSYFQTTYNNVQMSFKITVITVSSQSNNCTIEKTNFEGQLIVKMYNGNKKYSTT